MAINVSSKIVSGDNLRDTLILFKEQFSTDIIDNLGDCLPVKYSDFVLQPGTNGNPDMYTCTITHTLNSVNIIGTFYDLNKDEEWCLIKPLDETTIEITNDRRISGVLVVVKERS